MIPRPESSRRGPLTDITVLDLTWVLSGPFAAMILADMGADVIRIDRRGGSEDRYVGPVAEGGEGGMFLSLNRNKRSLTLDPGQPHARATIT